MEILGKLFGSASRVKIMRLFLFSPEILFTNEDIKKRTKVQPATFRKEMNLLEKVGFVERKTLQEDGPTKGKKKRKSGKNKKSGFILSADFPFIDQFRSVLINTETLEKEAVVKKLEKTGRLKLVLISGVFLGRDDSRVDLLVVGNKINKSALENNIHAIEAEIGKELIYVIWEPKEFSYRQQVHDRLVRDILDYPHEKLLDRLNS